MLKLLKVTGHSLSPFFLSGDYVIIRTRSKLIPRLKAGDTVVVDHPLLGVIIKQVLRNRPAEEYLELTGTHPDSTSPQKIGPVNYTDVIGKVLFHIKQSA